MDDKEVMLTRDQQSWKKESNQGTKDNQGLSKKRLVEIEEDW